MPLLLEQPQLIAVLAFGALGAGAAAAGVFYLAASWKKRAGFAYGLSAFVFYGLVYIATFQHGLMNSEIGAEAAVWMLTVMLLCQALVTSVGVGVFTLLVFGAWLTLLGELDFPVNRIKSYTGCAVFCFVFSAFLNPIGAARQTDDPSARSIYEAALSGRTPKAVEAARREAARTRLAVERFQPPVGDPGAADEREFAIDDQQLAVRPVVQPRQPVPHQPLIRLDARSVRAKTARNVPVVAQAADRIHDEGDSDPGARPIGERFDELFGSLSALEHVDLHVHRLAGAADGLEHRRVERRSIG
jgi:hypothetical protein